MKKTNLILIFTLIVIIIAIITTSQYFQDKAGQSVLNSLIDVSINNYDENKTPYIDLTNIETFSWDRLYIFGPYSRCDRIADTLEISYFLLTCKISGIENSENSSLFVFTEDGSIIQHTLYFGVVILRSKQDGYSREESQFIFDDADKMIWIGNN